MNIQSIIKQGWVEDLRILLRQVEKNNNKKLEMPDGELIIHYILKNKNTPNNQEILSILLEDEVDVNKKDVHGNNALMIAAAHKYDNIEEIAKRTKDINETNNFGNSALMIALSARNSVENINLLIKMGADVNKKNKLNICPQDIIDKYTEKSVFRKINSLRKIKNHYEKKEKNLASI